MGSELAGAARGSVITFVGSVSSAALGFVLSVLLARTLGTAGAGIVFQVIATFTIALSITRLGLDTTAVWLLPRLAMEEPGRVRAGVHALLVPALACSVLASVAWLAVSSSVQVSSDRQALFDALDVAAVFLPAAAVMTVALAATRAFGGVLAFNAVGNIGLPLLRPAGVLVAAALGGATTGAVLGWALPWLVGLLASLLVLFGYLRAPRWVREGGRLPGRALTRRISVYAVPRAIASALEQSIVWIGVILVGVLAGASAAGVYGAAARFVAAGLIVSTAIRIVVAPRFSGLLGERRFADVEELYSVTARWILLFGGPVYIVLAVFAPTVLGWLGPGFDEGVGVMVVLCLGSIVVLAAGNVQSLLLMSGRSGLGAVNKAVVLILNVGATLLLVPRFGIIGAAAAWAASMLLDTALAAWQVRSATGIILSTRSIVYVILLVSACVGVPSGAVVLLLGQGSAQLLLAAGVSGACLIGACVLDRERLHIDELARLGRR